MSDQNEIFELQQAQLNDLKEVLFRSGEENSHLREENKRLQQFVNNLKDNNNSLSQTFADMQKDAFSKLQNLEERLAIISVERAEKEMQIDALTHELNRMKKQMKMKDDFLREKDQIIQNLQQQLDVLMQPKDTSDSDSIPGSQEDFLGKINSQPLTAEQTNMTPEEFQQSKQQNKAFLLVVDSIKSAFNRGEQQSLRRKEDIRLMMDNLPCSSYQALYEDQLSKLNDQKAKTGELGIWEQEVMSLFLNEEKNEARINEKIGTYIRNFFPEKFRGKLWKFLVGNDQKLTKLLYQKILDTLQLHHPLVTEELLHLINSDLKRTFQYINHYSEQSKLKDDLKEILMVWSVFIYRPDIGYVQGMTYLAFMFLMRMDKIKAFKCFANLMFRSNLLLSLYQFKNLEIEAYFQTFNFFLAEKLPDVSKHMANYDIPKQAFLVEWFYTVFARAFNLIISSKCWDFFLFEGDVYVYRLCLGIFYLIQDDLLKCEYEDTLLLIRNCSVKLQEASLFKAVSKFKISKSTFTARYQKELSQLTETSKVL